MTPQQALLISLLLGRALDAILLNVRTMTENEVVAALEAEQLKTEDLLRQMREAGENLTEDRIHDKSAPGSLIQGSGESKEPE